MLAPTATVRWEMAPSVASGRGRGAPADRAPLGRAQSGPRRAGDQRRAPALVAHARAAGRPRRAAGTLAGRLAGTVADLPDTPAEIAACRACEGGDLGHWP